MARWLGETWCDYAIRLSDKAPAALFFHNALPATSGSSDGVDFRVFAAKRGERPKQLFQRFSASKEWEKARVDLSVFKGETITLRLWTGPGPKNNTNCDSSFWGDPVIVLGAPLVEPMEEEWLDRGKQGSPVRSGRGESATNVERERWPATNLFPPLFGGGILWRGG